MCGFVLLYHFFNFWQKYFKIVKFFLQIIHAEKKCYICNFLLTVWKFRNFSATQILREINCGDNLEISKTDIFEVVNFDFGNFQP